VHYPVAMASTAIKIAEDLHPVKSEPSFRATRSEALRAGGIYNPRDLSRVSAERRLSFARASHEHRSSTLPGADTEGDEWQPNKDVKRKQTFRGLTLLWQV